LQLKHACTAPSLGWFTSEGHKIWEWRYLVEENLLLWFHDGGMDIYTPSEVPRYANRPICWTCLHVDQQPRPQGVICSVLSIVLGVWQISSQAPRSWVDLPPRLLNAVFDWWGCTWLWKDLKWQGDTAWIQESIQTGDCMVVAEGLYMPDLHTDLCSTAFFFECKSGQGKLVGSFVEFSASSNAYWGELLGLMSHGSALSAHQDSYIVSNLSGKVIVYSDCEGVFDKLENLPPLCLPAK
jgi:hypothetical protein